MGLDSPAAALRHWEKVRALLAPAAQSEESVALRLRAASELLILSWRQGMGEDRVDEIFAEGRALAVAHGDVREQVRLLYGVGLYYMLNGIPRRAIPFFEESLALAEATGEPELRWTARETLGFALLQVGEFVTALRMKDEQIAISQGDPGIGIAMVGFSTSDAFAHRGWILTDLGQFEEAAEAFRRCEEMARRFNENEIMSWSDGFCAWMLERSGDAHGALSAARRSIESAEKIGSLIARVVAHGSYGMALTLNLDWEAARQTLELALEIARSNRVGLFMEGYFVAALAEAYLGLGDSLRARALAEEAIRLAEQVEVPVAEMRAQLALARVLRANDGLAGKAGIEAALDRAQALVESTGARSYEPQIWVERARLAGLLSDAAGRLAWLRAAHRLFTDIGAAGHAARVASELAGVQEG